MNVLSFSLKWPYLEVLRLKWPYLQNLIRYFIQLFSIFYRLKAKDLLITEFAFSEVGLKYLRKSLISGMAAVWLCGTDHKETPGMYRQLDNWRHTVQMFMHPELYSQLLPRGKQRHVYKYVKYRSSWVVFRVSYGLKVPLLSALTVSRVYISKVFFRFFFFFLFFVFSK